MHEKRKKKETFYHKVALRSSVRWCFSFCSGDEINRIFEADVWRKDNWNKAVDIYCHRSYSRCFFLPILTTTSSISTSLPSHSASSCFTEQQICVLSSKSFPSLADCSPLEYWPDSPFPPPSFYFPSGLIYIYARSN